MFELIESLRKKTPRAKKQIAFLVSFSLAGIIFVVWLTVIYPDFRKEQSEISSATIVEQSPFSHFTEIFSDGFNSIGEQITKIKESISILASSTASSSATATTPTSPSPTPPSFIQE